MPGLLFAIGGALDCTEERAILKRMLAAARGTGSSVCVVTSATASPEEARKAYVEAFAGLGIADCTILHPTTPAEADAPDALAAAARADIVFFTGGDQQKLVEAIAGSAFMQAVARNFAAGGIVAGTSAGAAALSKMMIYQEEDVVSLKDGFGFLDDAVVDTHFSQRQRLSRLFSMVAAAPNSFGIGVDENTAAIIAPDGALDVVGAGTVTVVTAASDVLRDGDSYDLKRKVRTGSPRSP